MSKSLRNGIIAGTVVVLSSALLGMLGETTFSATVSSMGLGAFTWFILQSLSGNRAVSNVPDADRNRLLAEPPPPGQALLYIYREGFMGRSVGWEVVLDGTPIAQLKSPRFTRVLVPAGDHVLLANPPGFAGTLSNPSALNFTVAPGETAVFALKIHMGMVKNQIDIQREPATSLARLGTITMVAPEPAPIAAPAPPRAI